MTTVCGEGAMGISPDVVMTHIDGHGFLHYKDTPVYGTRCCCGETVAVEGTHENYAAHRATYVAPDISKTGGTLQEANAVCGGGAGGEARSPIQIDGKTPKSMTELVGLIAEKHRNEMVKELGDNAAVIVIASVQYCGHSYLSYRLAGTCDNIEGAAHRAMRDLERKMDLINCPDYK